MKYIIKWKGENIDEFEDKESAYYCLNEYNLAFKGGCTIKKVKE
jgi:hypothetical protein